MKKAFIGILVLLALPTGVFAHAVPLESTPASSASLTSAPDTVEIRFSERIDAGASRIHITGPNSADAAEGAPHNVDGDPYRLAVGVSDAGAGAYIVEWSVVSRDDGHFTKGAFPFAVGEGVELVSISSDTEIIQIATLPEIAGMTLELTGHGMLWAILVLFAFAIRPLLREGRFVGEVKNIHRLYVGFTSIGAGMALAGGAFQIVTKAQDLALLHGSELLPAIELYASTAAGTATVVRFACASLFALLAYLFAARIVRATRFTWQEGILIATLAIFAFMRAKVSHATANHFFPDLSVAVNFVHLIDKDIWTGLLLILSVLVIVPRLRGLFPAVLQKAFLMLTINLAVVSLTASYIVWLHLKDWSNLFTTQWGSAFLELALAAVLLVAARTYHAITRTSLPRLFRSLAPLTLGAELALSIAVIYLSSAVIITSPPPEMPPMPGYTARSEGATIELSHYPFRDGMVRLEVKSDDLPGVPSATVRSSGTELEIDLTEAYPGTYLFPAALLGRSDASVSVRAPQTGAYDAVATFEVAAGAYDESSYRQGQRGFDTFTGTFIVLALLGVAYALYLRRYAVREADDHIPFGSYADLRLATGFIAALLISGGLIAALTSSGILNRYRAMCEADGNMWHIMLPTWAGQPRSLTPREGCMWGMGSYQYLFPERAEYEYYASLPPTRVDIAFDRDPVAGEPTDFAVSIRQEDGAPATLLVDMERLVHVVIVSKDQTEYAHIHPDDARELTDEEVRTSTFRFTHTFPKAGEYLISVDYASGVDLRSAQIPVTVPGAPKQAADAAVYDSPANVGDYTVRLEYSQPFAGDVSTFVYHIEKDGQPATLEPYLSAAMHIAVVKNDFGAFAHTHGEVHPPGTSPAPVVVRDGKIVHSIAAMWTPAQFDYPVDAHVLFPEPGLYTLWGQFQSGGTVYAVPFSVRVE